MAGVLLGRPGESVWSRKHLQRSCLSVCRLHWAAGPARARGPQPSAADILRDMIAADVFATKPTLQGDRAGLRQFTPEDITAMADILTDPEVLRLTGSVHSTAEAKTEAGDKAGPLDPATRRWYETRADQKDRLDLAVIAADSGACVGEVVLNE